VEKRVHTVDSLAKGGAYSHAIEAGALLFVSGMLRISPDKSATVDDIETATKLALTNLKTLLESSGSGLQEVVKVTVFLRDSTDFKGMNDIYSKFFSKEPPTRSCVVVKEIPGGFPVEIEAIAVK